MAAKKVSSYFARCYPDRVSPWRNVVFSTISAVGGNTSGGDTLSKLLGQDPRLRSCIGQANQNFNTQTQNAGINTNVSPETRNFDLKTAFGLNSGMGKFATTFAVVAGILRGGVNGGVLGALTAPAARSIYALGQTLNPAQYVRDVLQADKDYNQQVAACHQAYGN